MRSLQAVETYLAATDRFNTVGFIMDYEAGNLDHEEIVRGFQHLIDTGIVWTLQGSYGRMATVLIASGECYPASTLGRKEKKRS